jgi:hypothetical protein
LLLRQFLPEEIDATRQSEVLLPRDQEMRESIPIGQLNQAKMGFYDIFSRPKLFFSMFCGCMAYLNGTLMEPVLALRLQDFNFNQTEIGFYYAAFPIFYILTALSVERWPKFIDKRVFLFLGFVLATLS